MSVTKVGSGGFYLPTIYQQNQASVAKCVSEGCIDYADATQWTFSDEFLCFALQQNLLNFIDSTYPNPRQHNEIPIWFLVSCQFILRLNQTGQYKQLDYLLNSGSLLTRFGFNVGAKAVGFNEKNKQRRKTVVAQDGVRKFFKDTSSTAIRRWYNEEMQQWFHRKKSFEHRGLFVLDQTHIVVPDNPNYQDAVKLPVDEHGQWYRNLREFSSTQKKALKYHPCYAMSTLLNVSPEQASFHIAGYELGRGNEDELCQAEKLVPMFIRNHPGVMKELIIDRGYISGEFISQLKNTYNVDVLIPLKKTMHNFTDALALAKQANQWEFIDEVMSKITGKCIKKTEAALIHNMDLWEGCLCKMLVVVSRVTTWNNKTQCNETRYFALASTKKYKCANDVIKKYRLRTQIEERFRQLKLSWNLTKFPSPNRSLIESHVCFTLLTYSLLQLYLHRNDLQNKNHQFLSTLRHDEKLGKDAVIVYAKGEFGVFDFDDYLLRVMKLDEQARNRMIQIITSQKETRLARTS